MENSGRKELKYVITTSDYARLKSKLAAYLRADKHMRSGFYEVRSLYFDTFDDVDLFDSIFGNNEKSKIRLRIYPPEMAFINLELKEKSGSDGFKASVDMTREEAGSLLKSRYSFLLKKQSPEAIRIYTRLASGGYFPKSIVEYKRSAFYLPVSDTRITFDYDVGVSPIPSLFFNKKILTTAVSERNIGVLEIKYNDFLLGALKDVLKNIDNLNEANSKYMQSRLLFN